MDNQYPYYSYPETESAYQAQKTATLKEYLQSKEFLVTIALLFGGLLLLMLLFFFIILPLLTRHGSLVEVPNVTYNAQNNRTITPEEAKRRLINAGLSPVLSDSQFEPGLPPRVILRQEPPALSQVKPGRKVYLVMTSTTPPTVKVPDIKENSIEQARYLLENWRLKVGRITYAPGRVHNLVLAAVHKGDTLQAFQKVPIGSVIDLVVSQGPSDEEIDLPNIVDMPLDEAIQKLSDVGLRVGEVRRTVNKNYPETDVVISQIPRYGTVTKIKVGSFVDITVSGDDPAQQELEAYDSTQEANKEQPKPTTTPKSNRKN